MLNLLSDRRALFQRLILIILNHLLDSHPHVDREHQKTAGEQEADSGEDKDELHRIKS